VANKVFDWILRLIPDTPELKRILMKFLDKLVKIDAKQTVSLVQNWLDQKAAVRKLGTEPELQMDYLSKLVQDEDVDSDLLVLYIRLLAEHAPETVLPFLQSREDYPLEDCLEIC
jgi:hypothetical protein